MSVRVIVAYATKYGSTRDVAETIAEVLREGGLAVDLEPARTVKRLDDYNAVVLGAPIYIGTWHKDAKSFLAQHQQALAKRAVAIFGLGPIHPDEKEHTEALVQLQKELAKFTWLTPVCVEMFGGKLDPHALRFPDSLLVSLPASPLHNAPASDARDWEAIRAWACSVALRLKPV